VDWGVLKDSKEKGVYEMAPQISITDESLSAWLIEAALRASGSNSVPLKTLINSSSIFPFKIETPPISSLSGRVELLRQGVDEDIVMLKDGK
jgi:hypothetical protein